MWVVGINLMDVGEKWRDTGHWYLGYLLLCNSLVQVCNDCAQLGLKFVQYHDLSLSLSSPLSRILSSDCPMTPTPYQ